MNRIISYLLVSSIIFLIGCAKSEEESDIVLTRPNVVLIVADDQGAGDFSLYGNPYLETKNLDRLANQSAQLENFYVSPLCSPTRASLMTGRYNYRTGVWDTWKGRDMMRDDETTLAEVLKDNGYATALIGKWHLGSNAPFRALDQGFDYSFSWLGFDRINPVMIENSEKSERLEGYLPQIIADKAAEYIGQKRDKPFFAYVPFYTPHDHFDVHAPDSSVAKFDQYTELPQFTKEVYAMVDAMDKAIGTVLNALVEHGLEENTLVVFLSDNGHSLGLGGDHRFMRGLRGWKGQVYEGGIHLPCFIKHPSVEPRTVAGNAAHIDILPTILDLCGIDLPNEKKLDGISLAGLIKDNEPLPDRNLFIQMIRGKRPVPFANSTVISNNYKLVNDNELYDLAKDPAETTNLAEELPEVFDSLKNAYQTWFGDVTSERPFEPGFTHIGSAYQKTVTFMHYSRNDYIGFPIDVKTAGYYQFTFDNVQPQLFPSKGRIGISIGDKEWVNDQDITKGMQSAKLDSVYLEKGKYNMNIVARNKKPQKHYYGHEDMGFRKVNIEKL